MVERCVTPLMREVELLREQVDVINSQPTPARILQLEETTQQLSSELAEIRKLLDAR
jgi:hypothetical protein